MACFVLYVQNTVTTAKAIHSSQGCTSYKVDSVSKHQKPPNHEKALLLKKSKSERDRVTVSNLEAAKIINVLNRENFEKLNLLCPFHGV